MFNSNISVVVITLNYARVIIQLQKKKETYGSIWI